MCMVHLVAYSLTLLFLAFENGTISKKGNKELKLFVWQLTLSGQFPTDQFGISIGILCFKSIDFIKSQIWQH